MHARRAGFFLAMLFCGSAAAAQQTQVALRIVPDTTRQSAARKPSFDFAAAKEKDKFQSFAVSRRPFSNFTAQPPRPAPPELPRYRFGVTPALAPLRVTAERSSFLTEARIPVAQLWSGRLRFSAVQQRFHQANLYSALSPASLAEVGLAPGVESIVGRARVNYGVGLQLRFGR